MSGLTGHAARTGLALLGSLWVAGCGSDPTVAATGNGTGAGGSGGTTAAGVCVPDESAAVPARSSPGVWQRVEIEGAVCSNGTPYPIFVNYSTTSNNLVIMFEPGGACWDYESCSPSGGLRGAANPDGIAAGDTHMTARYAFLPLLRTEPEINPIHDWNKVFIPYCTGDIHTGNKVATYTGPAGKQIVFRHNGHDNVMRAIQWLSHSFTNVPRLLVTGCSAGGAGALLNYPLLRRRLAGVQCSYLLNDSGPIFPTASNSAQLQAKVREAWNTDPLIDFVDSTSTPEERARIGITAEEVKRDLGLINLVVARAFPKDRLSAVMYRRDLNYSLYSYERFFNSPPFTEIHRMWDEDLGKLRALYDKQANLGYFFPFFRLDNCSHCVTIPPIGLKGDDLAKALSSPWLGSEIQEANVNARDYAVKLLDDGTAMPEYFESDQRDEGFTPSEAATCQGL